MKRLRHLRNTDAGEVASWLILAAGLCMAAVAASAVLTTVIEQLTSDVASAAAGEQRNAATPDLVPAAALPEPPVGVVPLYAASDFDPALGPPEQDELLTDDEPITADEPPAAAEPNLDEADPNGHLAVPEVNPDFSSRVELVIADLQQQGYEVIVHMAYRSGEVQNNLYCQSRTSGICAGTGITGPQVTGAQAGESWHNYGLAADLVVRTPNGNPSWPDPDPFWDALGEAAESQGLSWGGGSGDRPHVEYHPAAGEGFISASELQEPFAEGGLEAAWEAAGATP